MYSRIRDILCYALSPADILRLTVRYKAVAPLKAFCMHICGIILTMQLCLCRRLDHVKWIFEEQRFAECYKLRSNWMVSDQITSFRFNLSTWYYKAESGKRKIDKSKIDNRKMSLFIHVGIIVSYWIGRSLLVSIAQKVHRSQIPWDS